MMMRRVIFGVFLTALSGHADPLPWHLKVNDLDAVWGLAQGNGVVVCLVDTTAYFQSLLTGKQHDSSGAGDKVRNMEHFRQLYEEHTSPGKSFLEAYADFGHGTAMASIIVANKGSVPQEDAAASILIAGLAPLSKISDLPFGYSYIDRRVIEGRIITRLNQIVDNVDECAEPVCDAPRRYPMAKVVVINLSAKERSKYPEERDRYREFLQEATALGRILLVASAGNDGKDLQTFCVHNSSMPNCLESFENAMIKVGSVGRYDTGNKPPFSEFSNYGPGFV